MWCGFLRIAVAAQVVGSAGVNADQDYLSRFFAGRALLATIDHEACCKQQNHIKKPDCIC